MGTTKALDLDAHERAKLRLLPFEKNRRIRDGVHDL